LSTWNNKAITKKKGKFSLDSLEAKFVFNIVFFFEVGYLTCDKTWAGTNGLRYGVAREETDLDSNAYTL
jgi:hypothetical protein